MNDCYSICIARKEVEKAIINELYKKDIIDFFQCNSIIKKLDDDIIKLENKNKSNENKEKLVIKIPI